MIANYHGYEINVSAFLSYVSTRQKLEFKILFIKKILDSLWQIIASVGFYLILM